MRRASLAILGAALAAACSAPPTEILVEVDSDLAVPGELDSIVVTFTHPDGAPTREATARLGAGEAPLPRTAAMVHEGGPLGPYRVVVSGRLGGATVVERAGELTFVEGEIRVWRVRLTRSCAGMDCGDQTCAAGACRAVDVASAELLPYPAPAPDAGDLDGGGAPDAGPPDAGESDAGVCAATCTSVGCSCPTGCSCDLTCADALCDPRCAGDTTVCTIDASGSTNVEGRCDDGATCTIDATGVTNLSYECGGGGATCDVDCNGATSCSVRCAPGGVCLLRCAEATSCAMDRCPGGETTCPGDVIVCNRECP